MNKFKIFWVMCGISLVVLSGLLFQNAQAREISFGGGYVLNVEKISNTDQCLTDCYLDLRLSLNQDYLIDNVNKFRLRFERKIGEDLTDYGFKILKNVSYDIWIPDFECTTEQYVNLTEYTSCIDNGYYETRYRDVWDSFNPLGKTIKADKEYFIRIYGKRKPTIEQQEIDVVPVLFEQDLPEYEWWNSTWQDCKNITIQENSGFNIIDQEIEMNLTDLTFASTDEIRIVNAPCNESGSEITRDIITSGSDYVNTLFMANLTASTNTTYSVYYNTYEPVFPLSYPDKVITSSDCSFWDCSIQSYSNIENYEYGLDYNGGPLFMGRILTSDNVDLAENSGNLAFLDFYGGGVGWIFHSSVTTVSCFRIEDGYLYTKIDCEHPSGDSLNYTFYANNKFEIVTNGISVSDGVIRLAAGRIGYSNSYGYNGTGSYLLTGNPQGFGGEEAHYWGIYSTANSDFWVYTWLPNNVEWLNHSGINTAYADMGRDYLQNYAMGTGTSYHAFYLNVNGTDNMNHTELSDKSYALFDNPPNVFLGSEESGPPIIPVNVSANITITFILDPSELAVNSRSTCAGANWLQTDSFVRNCIGEEGTTTPNCYWNNQTTLFYCVNGCYDNITEFGSSCAPTEFNIYLYGLVIFLISIIVISYIFKGKRRR